jgi:cytochrome c
LHFPGRQAILPDALEAKLSILTGDEPVDRPRHAGQASKIAFECWSPMLFAHAAKRSVRCLAEARAEWASALLLWRNCRIDFERCKSIVVECERNELDQETIMKLIGLAAVLAGCVISHGSALAQDAAAGEKIFNTRCKVCHQIGEGAKNAVGPVLNGLIGRKTGTVEGYNYSEANKNSGLTWDEATFRDYIKNPRAKISGTKMVFAGLPKDEDVENILAFLKQFGADGKKVQ